MSTTPEGFPDRTLALVISSLGGEGGGVLADWVVKAAEFENYPVQSTSIPGVAQRTGATTYYIEMYPVTHDRLGGRSPVMAMYQTPGNMDMVICSELMEAGRAMEIGMVSPDRTTLIASTHRAYSILERSAMGDELFDGEDVLKAGDALSKRSILFDMERLCQQTGVMINAVLLGVIAGSGELPIKPESFEQAIEKAGVAAKPNIQGFRTGLAYVRGELQLDERPEESSRWGRRANMDDLLTAAGRDFPPEAAAIVTEGVRRVVDYQSTAYGSAYLARMAAVLDSDKAADGASRGFKLTAETGRYLALWMSFEDIIRVADLKSRPERMARVRKEVGAKDNEPVVVTEYLKPGFEEFASVMPPALGRAVMNWRDQKEWRRDFHFAMRIKTNSFFGFFRLWMLARMQWWRPRTYRFAEEQASIGAWLDALRDASARNYDLAVEIAELPRLRKGYSDTHQRGTANYQRIFDTLASPVAGFAGDGTQQANALRAAREAALADEEGKALDQLLGQTQIPAQLPREAAE
ncbi:MAG: indolepyruvate oxidoreductase subunit beta family protein [Rhodospirillales bacterium]|nr:indolepyruvate oxidoreductase subunit beta family protein [Rhodospirillales bacterium]